MTTETKMRTLILNRAKFQKMGNQVEKQKWGGQRSGWGKVMSSSGPESRKKELLPKTEPVLK